MRFTSLSLSQTVDLCKTDKEFIVLRKVVTKDLVEYYNNIMIVLANDGFDTNLLLQPKVRRISNFYDIIIAARRVKGVSELDIIRELSRRLSGYCIHFDNKVQYSEKVAHAWEYYQDRFRINHNDLASVTALIADMWFETSGKINVRANIRLKTLESWDTNTNEYIITEITVSFPEKNKNKNIAGKKLHYTYENGISFFDALVKINNDIQKMYDSNISKLYTSMHKMIKRFSVEFIKDKHRIERVKLNFDKIA